MMVAATVLAVMTLAGVVTPIMLLGLMFVFGLGFAFNGPALAGVLIAGVGPGAVFGVNAVSFVGALIVLARWRRPATAAPGPREGVGEAVAAGVRFVRFTPEITAVLFRTAVFIISGSALWALVPIIARQELGLESVGYGTLLAFFGIGTIGWTGMRERVEERLSPEAIVTSATVLFAATMASLAVVRSLGALYLTMAAGGLAWIALLTSFNVATQTAVPGWVRARGLATFQTVFMIGMGAGGAVWGAATSTGSRR
jgi:predicted MFS family arabinose efflux permease